MSPARLRGLSILALLALNAAVVLAWSQGWLDARAEGQRIPVPGSSAGGATLPLALSGMVVAAALALAGPVFRVILGILQALLGVCVAIVAGTALTDPAAAARTEVATTTGLVGTGAGVTADATLWPGAALALGVLLAVAGLGILVTARRWPRTTSRFERNRVTPAEPGGDPIREWDALSGGEDPTTGAR
ncbi:MAG: Trp biosynthesis-associated membrane protein [Micrococcales bacterium]|nr:Trp biosynthesis-associated membrane protein [Micrococcales bacterium]